MEEWQDIENDPFGISYVGGFALFLTLALVWGIGMAVALALVSYPPESGNCCIWIMVPYRLLGFIGVVCFAIAFAMVPFDRKYDQESASDWFFSGFGLMCIWSAPLLLSGFSRFCRGNREEPCFDPESMWTFVMGHATVTQWIMLPGLALLALYCNRMDIFTPYLDEYHGLARVMDIRVDKYTFCIQHEHRDERGSQCVQWADRYYAEPIVEFGSEWACHPKDSNQWCQTTVKLPECRPLYTSQEADDCARAHYAIDYFKNVSNWPNITTEDLHSDPNNSTTEWPTVLIYGDCATCDVVTHSQLQDVLILAQGIKLYGIVFSVAGVIAYALLVSLYWCRYPENRPFWKKSTLPQSPPDTPPPESHPTCETPLESHPTSECPGQVEQEEEPEFLQWRQ